MMCIGATVSEIVAAEVTRLHLDDVSNPQAKSQSLPMNGGSESGRGLTALQDLVDIRAPNYSRSVLECGQSSAALTLSHSDPVAQFSGLVALVIGDAILVSSAGKISTLKRRKHRAPAAISVFRLAVTLLACLFTFCVDAADKEAATPRTHSQLLASYLHKLPQYTEWPKDTFVDENAPFIIGLLGDDPFQEDADLASGVIKLKPGEIPLEAILRHLGMGGMIRVKAGENVLLKRKVAFKHFKRVQEDIAGCHLLFVSSSWQNRLPDILRSLDKASVLTVGDASDFIDRDGIINCVARKTVDGKEKMSLGVNLVAAKRNNLKLDAALYSAAERRIKS
jgi:hypothetical protein